MAPLWGADAFVHGVRVYRMRSHCVPGSVVLSLSSREGSVHTRSGDRSLFTVRLRSTALLVQAWQAPHGRSRNPHVHASCMPNRHTLKAFTSGHPFCGRGSYPSFLLVFMYFTRTFIFIYRTHMSRALPTSQALSSVPCECHLGQSSRRLHEVGIVALCCRGGN